MPLITETYYLSLTQDNRGILRLRCSQDDTLRTVNLKLYNNGSIFVIPSGVSASISGVRQNGTVFSKPCTISQDRQSVVLQLSSDITNVDGIIVAEIVLNDGEGGRLGTSNFIIQVEKNPIRAGVVQDTETPIEYINDFIEKIQTLTARLNNLITPSGDASLAEVVDARIGILDSTTYQTLGARLNAEFQRLSNALNGVTILESTGDTTDRTSEILSKLNAYGTCKLGKGDFYVNSLVMPEGSHLVGSCKSTRIILPSSVTSGYVVKPRSNCIIENISFYGGFTGTHSELIASSATATRHCIILDRFNSVSSENVILNNIFINNFVGSAIIQRYAIGCHCEDIIINMCYACIDISNASYDGQCTNISMINTRYGVVQNGSNFVFTNCVSKDSDQHILSDQQNTECTFSSCTFSDSSLETTSRLATLSNARNGFVFDNCIFDSSLKMLLNACDGIVIKGTNFVGSDTFRIIVSNSRNTLLLITDCIADVEPIVTNAGTAARITSCYLKDGIAWSISEADITVDEELSDESENPIQNKAVASAISDVRANLDAQVESIDGRLLLVEDELGVNPPDIYTGTITEANVSTIIADNLSFERSTQYRYTFSIQSAINTNVYVYFHRGGESDSTLFSKTIAPGETSVEKLYTTSASYDITEGFINAAANATGVTVKVAIESAVGVPTRLDDIETDITAHGTAIDGLTSRTTVLESEVGVIDVSVNRLNPFTVTTGKYINMSGAIGNNNSLLYTDYIKVNPGERINLVNDGVCDGNTRFRYLTAYDSEKVVIPASGKETSYRYDVPEGVAYIIMTLYAADYVGGKLAININDVLAYSAYGDAFSIVSFAQRLKQYPYRTLPDYILGGAWYKPLGSLSKGYFCFVTDDGRIGMNEYTIPTLVIGKGVKCTFAIMSASEVMADAEKIAVVKDAVDNYGCSVAQHGGNRWTSFTEPQLNEFFDTEKAFFDGIGIEVRGAVIPEHYNSQLIYAMAGGKYGVVRSGYNGHIYPTVCPYANYANGPRSNLYGLTSYNIVDYSLANNKAIVDSAIANHYLMIVYIHENSLDNAKKAVIEGLMDYVNETGITQITLGDIPNII